MVFFFEIESFFEVVRFDNGVVRILGRGGGGGGGLWEGGILGCGGGGGGGGGGGIVEELEEVVFCIVSEIGRIGGGIGVVGILYLGEIDRGIREGCDGGGGSGGGYCIYFFK